MFKEVLRDALSSSTIVRHNMNESEFVIDRRQILRFQTSLSMEYSTFVVVIYSSKENLSIAASMYFLRLELKEKIMKFCLKS